MKYITSIPYEDVSWLFIRSKYDIYLSGLCTYNDNVCYFKSQDWDGDADELPDVDIYKLSWKEKIRELYNKWLFEKCIGYHYSYQNKKRGKSFYYRNPKWLYIWLFKKYFKL